MGGNFVANPHPPSYYFYGAGGSGYYGPAATVTTLDEIFADPGMLPGGPFSTQLQADAVNVAAMGLKLIAYEGGPSLDRTGGARDAVAAVAVADSRMTNAMIEMHNNAWSANGGDLLVYYTATGDYQWGFASDIYNLATPKLDAIDALNATPRAPVSIGTLVPGSVAGIKTDVCSRGWQCRPSNPWDAFTADGFRYIWAGYLFNSTAAASWTVNLAVAATTASDVSVYVDGVLVGTQNTTGGPLSFPAGTIGAGLHGVVVRAVTGSFTLDTIGVATN
jgi:hypothetical protein